MNTTQCVTTTYGFVFACIQAELNLLTGASIEVPKTDLDEWLLNVAPSLDKELCRTINDDMVRSGPTWCCLLPPPALLRVWSKIVTLRDDLPTRFAYIIRLVRSGLLCRYKVSTLPTNEQELTAAEKFLQTDERCAEYDRKLSGRLGLRTISWPHELETGSSSLDCECRLLLAQAAGLVRSVVGLAAYEEHIPRHGPGAVFPPQAHWERGRFDLSKTRHMLDSAGVFVADNGLDSFIGPIASETCKFTCVPKDARGPRTICIHSAEAMWLQQSYRTALESAISKHPVFGAIIHLDDQTVNQELCRLGSMTGHLATLDLKDASDCLCQELVLQLVGPEYYSEIASCRARSVYVDQTGLTHPMQKFAPMGNALVFPIQSLVYASLAVVVCKAARQSLSSVGVFGDDIIVPSEVAAKLCDLLHWVGLQVNTTKSFVYGAFRESCGLDAWAGLNVTPLRLKVAQVRTLSDAIEWCAFANNWHKAGYPRVARQMFLQLRGHTRFDPIRTNNVEAAGLVELYSTKPAAADYIPGDGRRVVLRVTSNGSTNYIWHPGLQTWGSYAVNTVERTEPRLKDEPHHVDESLWRLRSKTHSEGAIQGTSREMRWTDTHLGTGHKRAHRIVRAWVPLVLNF